MNRTALIALFVVAGCGLSAHGQTVDELKIKTHSVFNGPVSMRNPFWPVGWRKAGTLGPSGTGASAPAPVISIKPELFSVSSISTGAIPIAVINGKMYGEGELIPFAGGGLKPSTAQVFSIKDGQVTLRFEKQTVTIFQKGAAKP